MHLLVSAVGGQLLPHPALEVERRRHQDVRLSAAVAARRQRTAQADPEPQCGCAALDRVMTWSNAGDRLVGTLPVVDSEARRVPEGRRGVSIAAVLKQEQRQRAPGLKPCRCWCGWEGSIVGRSHPTNKLLDLLT